MKYGLVKFIFIILFLTQFVYAQNLTLNDYNNLDLDIKLFSNAEINPLNNNYEIDYIHANLSFFPKHNTFLEIYSKKFDSNQEFKLAERENYILYEWQDPKPNLLGYTADFKVKSNTNFREIRNIIKLPKQINSIYTQPTKLINSDDPIIKAKASEITKDSNDLYETVYELALWTNKNINYSLETLTEKATQNSRWVLDNKKGVCDELTALFVAMTRSLGIESRFVSGVSYTNKINDFGGHAWAEVYFPGEGWIPFDPTYGQYGYIDATHIKMQEIMDDNAPSVNYAWKYKDVDINFKEFNFSVNILNFKEERSLPIEFKINLLENELGPGSYAPLELEIENLADYYMPVTFYITKGPSLLEDNKIEVLLKPGDRTRDYKLIPIPINLEKGYSYESLIEVTDGYGKTQNIELKYSNDFGVYTIEKAQNKIDTLTESEERNILTDLYFNCKPKKDIYYKYETMVVSCDIRNNGNKDLEDMNVCLNNDCKHLTLIINQDNIIDFIVLLNQSLDDEIAVKAENPNILKYSYVKLNVLENPGLKIENLNISDKLNYKDRYDISFVLKSDANVFDLKIFLNDNLLYSQDSFANLEEFLIKLKGKNFYNKGNALIVAYKDENDAEYKFEENLDVEVLNIPWYVRFWNNIF